jgi:hypothetical protein
MTVVASNYCLRKCPLTLSGSLVSETATYAVLFDGSGDTSSFGTRLPDELFMLCQSNGGDICFTLDSAGEIPLPVELVAINTSAKTAEIWVAVPLTAATNLTIYVWYQSNSGTLARPAATAANGSQAVWSAVGNMVAVYHFGTPSAWSGLDSTNNDNSITAGGNQGTAGTGKIGGDTLVNCGGNYVATGSGNNLPMGGAARTLQTWFKINQSGNTNRALGGWGQNVNLPGGNGDRWNHWYWGGSSGQVGVETEGQAVQINWTPDSNWHSLVSVNPASNTTQQNILMFLDGASATVAGYGTGYGDTFNTSGTYIAIGSIPGYGGGQYFAPGEIDEFRICAVARSANYLATDYAAQSSNALITVGTPTAAGTSSVVNPASCLRVCPLTINGTLVAESAVYAVLFDGSGDVSKFGTRLPDELFTLCQADGGDICFTLDAAGTVPLSVEVVALNATAKTAEIWVAVPLVAATDLTIYVWYQSGNGRLLQPAATAPNGSQGVWNGFTGVGGGDNLVALVSHDGGETDSTGNASPVDYLTNLTAGQIGTATSFNQPAIVNAIATLSAAGFVNTYLGFTAQLWHEYTAVKDYGVLLRIGMSGLSEFMLATGEIGSPSLAGNTLYSGFRGYNALVSNSSVVALDNNQNSWHQLAVSYNGGGQGTPTNYIYAVDGSPLAVSQYGGIGGGSGTGIVMGNDSNGSGQFVGNLDEVRITFVGRSANYLATDHSIQSSTSLVTVGTPTTAAATTGSTSDLILSPVRREQFENLSASQLASAALATATTITVTDGSQFPTGGDFRLLVDQEIMLCVAVASNVLTVLRGQENTVAAAHVSGAVVAHILTQGSLQTLLQDNVPYTSTLQRPFRLVDALGNPLGLSDFGIIAQVGGGWVRQVDSTIEVALRYGNGSYHAVCLTRPLPASSQVTACVTGLSTTWGGTILSDVGIGLINLASFQQAAGGGGNGRLITCWFANETKLTVAEWLATNNRGSIAYNGGDFSSVSRLWLQVRVNGDGTSSYSVSADGVHWTLLSTYAATSPALDTVVFWAGTQNYSQETGTLLAWDEGA